VGDVYCVYVKNRYVPLMSKLDPPLLLLYRQHHRVTSGPTATDMQERQAKMEVAVIHVEVIKATKGVRTSRPARPEADRRRTVGGTARYSHCRRVALGADIAHGQDHRKIRRDDTH